MDDYVNTVTVFLGASQVGKTSLSTGYGGLMHRILETVFAREAQRDQSEPQDFNTRVTAEDTRNRPPFADSGGTTIPAEERPDRSAEYYLSVFEIYEDCVVDHFGPEESFESSISSPRITDAKCESLDQALQLMEHARAQSSNYSDSDGLTRAEPIPSSSLLLSEVKVRRRTNSGSVFLTSSLVVDLVADDSQTEFLEILRTIATPGSPPVHPTAPFIPYLVSRLKHARIVLLLLLNASQESLQFSRAALPVLDFCRGHLASMDLPGGTLAIDTDGTRTQTVCLGTIKNGADVLLATHVGEEDDGATGGLEDQGLIPPVNATQNDIPEPSLPDQRVPAEPIQNSIPPEVDRFFEVSDVEADDGSLPARAGPLANDESSYLQGDHPMHPPGRLARAVTFATDAMPDTAPDMVQQEQDRPQDYGTALQPRQREILSGEHSYSATSDNSTFHPQDPVIPELEPAPKPLRAKSASRALSPPEAAILRRYSRDEESQGQMRTSTLREARIRFQEAERALMLSEQQRAALSSKVAEITAEIAERSLTSELKLRAAQKRLDDIRSIVSRGLDIRGGDTASPRNPLNKQGIVDLQNILTACEGDLRELESQLYSAATQASENTIQAAYELCPRGASVAHIQHLVTELRNLTARHVALEKAVHKLQRKSRGTHAKILLFRDLESKHRLVSEECSRRTAERKGLEREVEQLRDLLQRTQLQVHAARQEATAVERDARDLEVELSTLKLARRNLEGLTEEATTYPVPAAVEQTLHAFPSEERATLKECRRLVQNVLAILSPEDSAVGDLSLSETALLDALRGRLQEIDQVLD